MCRRRTRSVLALATAAAAWGSTFVVIKAALEDVGPFTLLAVRFALALTLLAAVSATSGWLRVLRRPSVVLFGLALAVHFGLQTVGLAFTAASRAALIIAAVPVATAVGAALWLGERLSTKGLGGVALSTVGAAVLVGAPSATGASVIGEVLVVGSVLAWACYTVLGRRLAADVPPLDATLASTAVSTMVFLIGAALELVTGGMPSLDYSVVWLLVYLAAVPSALAFWLWNWGLQEVEAAVAGPFINLVPVTGVGFALLLGDSLSVTEAAGAAVVAAGVWVSQRSPRGRGTGQAPSSSAAAGHTLAQPSND